MNLSILLHVISHFSFHSLTILWAEVLKKYLQYFQNTIQSGDKSFVAFGNTPRLFASELDIRHMFR